MRIHADDRRRFVADLFPTEGDVNVVTLLPGVTIAWHRHRLQTDYLYCVKGMVKVGCITEDNQTVRWHVLSEWDPHVLSIPPGVWHGYKNLLPEPAILLGYISRKWDGSDEERLSIEEVGIPW